MDTQFYFSKFSSGENSVELLGKGDRYQVISNDLPVFSSDSLPESLGRYYKEISNLNSAQESGKDISLSLFADEVVKLNRLIIPKLSMLGREREVKYMKSLNSALEQAMDYFFQDTLEQKVKAIKLWKADPMTALASTPSVNGDELMNQGAGETTTPRGAEALKKVKKLDDNTIELKAVNPHVTAPFPGEDEFKMPIEPPTKVKATMQMKNHPKKQEPITGEEIEPVYIKRSRIEKDEAFELGRDLGVNFDKISLEQWMEGLKIEHEHTDLTGDDHKAIGMIAHAHLKERPDYYKLLEEYVEKSLRKDFNKMEEGDQAHDSISLENKVKTGEKQEPIDGGDEKLEKEAFSMDAPKVKNMETQEPIMHKSESNPSETNGHGEESSKREADYVGELSNQVGPPKKIEINTKTGEEEQTEDGGDVRENGRKYFEKSLRNKLFDRDPIIWNIEEF